MSSRLKSTVSGTINNDKTLYEAVMAANAVLLEIIGEQGAEVSADWSMRVDEKGRPLLILLLKDFTTEQEERLAPDEIKSPRQRLQRAWDAMVSKSSL